MIARPATAHARAIMRLHGQRLARLVLANRSRTSSDIAPAYLPLMSGCFVSIETDVLSAVRFEDEF